MASPGPGGLSGSPHVPSPHAIGDLISRLTSDTTMVSDLVSQNINIFLRNTVKVTGVVVFMFSLSWQLSLVTFMGFPIIMMVSDTYGKYYKVGPRTSSYGSPVRPIALDSGAFLGRVPL